MGLETKKDEWKARKELMVGEIAAINKAIAILHSDDARDLFKKSFKSQGYSFLQMKAGDGSAQTLSVAIGLIRGLARDAGDKRLVALATRLALGTRGHFDEVIKAI